MKRRLPLRSAASSDTCMDPMISPLAARKLFNALVICASCETGAGENNILQPPHAPRAGCLEAAAAPRFQLSLHGSNGLVALPIKG